MEGQRRVGAEEPGRFSRRFHLRSSETSAVENPEVFNVQYPTLNIQYPSGGKGTADFRAEAQRSLRWAAGRDACRAGSTRRSRVCAQQPNSSGARPLWGGYLSSIGVDGFNRTLETLHFELQRKVIARKTQDAILHEMRMVSKDNGKKIVIYNCVPPASSTRRPRERKGAGPGVIDIR